MASICCRLCLLNGPDLLPIQKHTVNSNMANELTIPGLSELIVSYLSIEPVTEGTTETYTCSKCRKTIAKWHCFRESCLQNDGVYQKIAQDPEKEDSPELIYEYHIVEVKQEQEIEMDEHEFNEYLFAEPLDEGRTGEVVEVEVKQEKEVDINEEELPMDSPPEEKLEKKRSPFQVDGGEPSVRKKTALPASERTRNRFYRCPFCTMIFHTKTNWKDHVNIHTKEIKYSCPTCDKVFWRKETLEIHLKSHSEEPPPEHSNLQCPYCPKMYRYLSVLLDHQRTHTEDPHVQCEGCERKFHSKAIMYRHAVTHTVEKSIACNICHRGFNRKNNLMLHMKYAHP